MRISQTPSAFKRLALRGLALLAIGFALAACGGGGGSTVASGAPGTSTPPIGTSTPPTGTTTVTPTSSLTYTISGTLNGLATGQSLVVQDISGAQVTLSRNGSYSALTNLPNGTAYNLSIATQPQAQVCSIGNASGTLVSANVSNVDISCGGNALALLAGNVGGPGNLNGSANSARFNYPGGVAIDSSGNFYVADTYNSTIRKINAAGVVSTFAGSDGGFGYADGTGTAAMFNNPHGVATDGSGNVYVADTQNSAIRKITPDGVVSTFAGSLAGTQGFTNGTGTAAQFGLPQGIATDSSGNVYVADTGYNNIRKITPAGVVTTLAGSGSSGAADGTGTVASFSGPMGVATDGSGNVYVADTGNSTIRKITPAGVVSTLAGLAGNVGYAEGTGSAASFGNPQGVSVDSSGNVYVADSDYSIIRKITPAGVVSTLAGTAGNSGYADGTGAAATFFTPQGIASDASGKVFVADSNSDAIRKITPAGVVSTFAGMGATQGFADGTGAAATFNGPSGNTAADSYGNVYVADTYNQTIRKITPAGVVSTFAGTAGAVGSADGTGAAASFSNPMAVATDNNNNVYVADTANNTIRKITSAGVVTTLAGTATTTGYADGSGAAASFNQPSSLATDSSGNVYVADMQNSTIRKITPAGVVSTFAGTAGVSGSADGTGTVASFYFPSGVATDSSDNVYVADRAANTIRKITPAGVVSTLATGFGHPQQGIATDSNGNIYVAEVEVYTIRKITPAGVVSTIIGTVGLWGNSLSSLPASLYSPQGLSVFGGKLFITLGTGVVWSYLP